MEDKSDEEIMVEVSEGNVEAFGELVKRHQQTAWGIAYWFLKDPVVAEDLAQEAFLKIFEAAPRYKPTAKFTTYLNRVVSRLCFDWMEKKRPKNIKTYPGDAMNSDAPKPDRELVKEEMHSELQEALQKLPDRQRMAILLQHLEEMSYQEIGEVMDITEKAVERLLARARNNLEEELGDPQKYLRH